MSPHPATPPPPPPHMRDPSHHLWASPQFSDYFSDAGDNAADGQKAIPVSPVQARILGRLDTIAKNIAGGAQNDGSQTPHLLDFDAELSALEARLNAPESQSREESAALFEAEDEVEAEILVEENEELRREVREGRDVIARVSKLRESLQGHYDEMKNNFLLAQQRLNSADEENKSLRVMIETLHKDNELLTKDNESLTKDNESLTKDNESLRDQNTRLFNDLSTAIPTIFRIKAHLDIIQSQVTASPSEQLEANVEQLQHDWADVDRDFMDIYKRYKKKGHAKMGRVDSMVGTGVDKESVEGSEVLSRGSSPETQHRSRIIIRRGGLIQRIDAELSAESSEGENTLGETLVGELEDQVQTLKEEVQTLKNEDKTSPVQEDDAMAIEPHKKERNIGATIASKVLTPWEELWDSIADFAGWHDAYEE